MYIFFMFIILIYHAKNKSLEFVKLCMGLYLFFAKMCIIGEGGLLILIKAPIFCTFWKACRIDIFYKGEEYLKREKKGWQT